MRLLPLACFTVSGVWWNKYVRLKLFQGVLVKYKIAGRDDYVNKMYTNPPVAALYFKAGGKHVLDYRRKGCKANYGAFPTQGKVLRRTLSEYSSVGVLRP